jgi:hypothetical protein
MGGAQAPGAAAPEAPPAHAPLPTVPQIDPAHNADATTFFDPNRYKGTPEERIAAWRAEVDATVKAKRAQLSARLADAQATVQELTPYLDSLTAMNAEDHTNYNAFIKSTMQARLAAAHGDPTLMGGADEASIMREFPFDSWARVPDARVAQAKTDLATATGNATTWAGSIDQDMATADNGMYKSIDDATKALGTYTDWDSKYRGAQSGNSVAEQQYNADVANYNRIIDEWQKYNDEEAQWQAQKAQLDADTAAGKFKVQNAWKAILSGKLTPAQQEQLMAQLESGNYNPNIGVPQLPPEPTPPAEAAPKAPPTPPEQKDLPSYSIDPKVAQMLGIPASHAGGAQAPLAPTDSRDISARTPLPVAPSTSEPWTAPTSAVAPAPTPAPAGLPWRSDHIPTLAEAQAYVYPKTPAAPAPAAPLAAEQLPPTTPPATPPSSSASGSDTKPPADSSTGSDTTPSDSSSPPADTGAGADTPDPTGSTSAGTGAAPKTQKDIGAGVDPQGSTNQTLAQAQQGQAPAAPQTTPSALSSLTSGASIDKTDTQNTGQTDGTAGQDKTTTNQKPQTTPPSILAPFQKQADIQKTPEQQDAWA